MTNGITFRPITDDDQEFLRGLYASTREEELKPVPWTAAEQAAFLAMQFHAQHTHYINSYPEAQFLIILSGEQPIPALHLYERLGFRRTGDTGVYYLMGWTPAAD